MAKSAYAIKRLAEIAAEHKAAPRRERPKSPTVAARRQLRHEEPRDYMPKSGQWFMRPSYVRFCTHAAGPFTISLRGFEKWRRPARVLPLDQLRTARLVCGSGIYFLWRGPELVYIGQSIYVPDRIRMHERCRDGLSNGKSMDFDRATSIRCPEDRMTDVEYEYICTYGPPFNDKWQP